MGYFLLVESAVYELVFNLCRGSACLCEDDSLQALLKCDFVTL